MMVEQAIDEQKAGEQITGYSQLAISYWLSFYSLFPNPWSLFLPHPPYLFCETVKLWDFQK